MTEQHQGQVPSVELENQRLKQEVKDLRRKLDFYKRWTSKLFKEWLDLKAGLER